MKRLDAANDNDAGKQIARTRQIWQPRLGRDLTDDDAHQIMHNVPSFFGLLAEWSRAERLDAANDAAMDCYRRAMIGEQTFEGRRENLAQANKLSRTYAALLEALNRHRGKGQQKVTVEHVHVHAGGQAVVGMVASSSSLPGGGDRNNLEEQPHAKQITHAHEPALRSQDPEREALPVACDAERPLPDARRTVSGGT